MPFYAKQDQRPLAIFFGKQAVNTLQAVALLHTLVMDDKLHLLLTLPRVLLARMAPFILMGNWL
ncbi:hypothetical protein CCP3SC15_830007 [Gammaproteobacteria bacterium]